MSLYARTSAIALLAMSVPAFADVTPAEVWQGWLDYYKQSGYTVTEGAREEAGGNLTLKDVVFTFDSPETVVTLTLPQLQMTGSDGKVTTQLPDSATTKVVAKDSGSEDSEAKGFELDAVIGMAGAQVVTSGVAADMTNETTAPKVTLTVNSLKTDRITFDKPVTLTMADVVGSDRIVKSDATEATYDFKAGRTDLDANFSGTDEDGQEGTVKIVWGTDSLQGKGTGKLPAGVDMKNLGAAMRAGLAGGFEFAMGPQKLTLDVDVPGEHEDEDRTTFAGNVDIKGATGSGSISPEGLRYQIDSDALSAELTTPDLPFPIKYAMDSASTELQMPVMKSDAPAPFKFSYSLGGLTLGDEVWGLFDAESKLPRDPANIDIDVTGLVKVAVDLMDPEAMAAFESGDSDEETMPFEPTEVTINQIALDALGAKVAAQGALKAPEGGSIEAPVGTISARYEGVNGLLDKLVQAGLLPEDQLQGARMMLMMFAKPAAEGQDVLTTDLEFKDDGSIFANGQQVK